MIVELLFNMIFGIVDIVIGLIPSIVLDTVGGASSMVTLLSYGLYFFPLDLWLVIIANIIVWLGVQGGWVVIEWCYKKIPGVD